MAMSSTYKKINLGCFSHLSLVYNSFPAFQDMAGLCNEARL